MTAPHYYLSCTCGKQVPVDAKLAGSTAMCACGKTLDVPTLRELRSLPLVPDSPVDHEPAEAPTSLGCLFGALLALAVLASATAGVASFLRQQIDLSYTAEMDLAAGEREIDRMGVDQAYELWKNFDHFGLGPPQPPPYILNMARAQRLRRVFIGAVTAGTLSLLGVVAVAAYDINRRRKQMK